MTAEEINKIITSSTDAQKAISALQRKSYTIPSWDVLLKDYEPKEHNIVHDHLTRKDKLKNGVNFKASRIYIGLEKLLVKRMTEFTFALPVKRICHNTEDSDVRSDIAKAIERIFKYARIDSENIKRGTNYYASCECCTMWYAIEKPNNLYGFNSAYKLKCKTYSPMDGVRLYPLFDDMDDLLAMSFRYDKEINGERKEYFETYTDKWHKRWILSAMGWVEDISEKIAIGKIPAIYISRPVPVYDGLSYIREEIEYTLSRNSDTIAYNSSPILAVKGAIQGQEDKGESNRLYRLEGDGSISYVTWTQSIEAMKYHVETLINQFWSQAQMPDISFANMKSLGNIGYDARQTLLTDPHLRIGDEAGAWLEFLDREVNVVKAYLRLLNPSWASEIDNVEVENVITPFIQNDEKSEIEKYVSANGGQAVISQLESIKFAGLSNDPQKTLDQINKEKSESTESRISNLFNEGAQ